MEKQTIDYISPVFVRYNDVREHELLNINDTYGKRVVENYEIEYIVSSRNGCILTDNLPLSAETGSVFFRFPGIVVEGIGIYRSIYIEFTPTATDRVLDVLHTLPLIYKNCDEFITEALMDSLFLPTKASSSEILLWKSKILQILSHLMEHSLTENESPFFSRDNRHLQPIKDVLSYIHLHYDQTITLQKLADISSYSSYHFCKIFKNMLHLTPMQYVVRYRMSQAEKKLRLSNDSIETIMLSIGFHNYGYFWRTFKEIYGSSPQEYRKKNILP